MATTSLPDMGAVGRGINSRLTILENGKAGLESPNFTGSPMAPTAPRGTNNTQIATTAFVQDAVSNVSFDTSVFARLDGAAFTGVVTVQTPTATTHAATKGYVDTGLGNKANTNSPTLTGTPKAPTATTGTKTTQLATTAFVHQEFDETKNLAEGVYGAFTSFNTDNGIV